MAIVPDGTFDRFRKGKEEPPSIICVRCEQRVPLWDAMEQRFASPEVQQRVRDLQEESAIELRNRSKERALVGEVISTVALADQISQEFNFSDQGIDMGIEFTDDAHEATGAKLYLQLKSGDSYLRERKGDGAEIFTIKDGRHARYWMAQAFPVLLVIRNAEGEVRWMEVRDWLKRASDNGKKPVEQIVFAGGRFDVMSVRRWREKVIARGQCGQAKQDAQVEVGREVGSDSIFILSILLILSQPGECFSTQRVGEQKRVSLTQWHNRLFDLPSPRG